MAATLVAGASATAGSPGAPVDAGDGRARLVMDPQRITQARRPPSERETPAGVRQPDFRGRLFGPGRSPILAPSGFRVHPHVSAAFFLEEGFARW